MSVPCEVMIGDELLGEIRKEFNYPYDFLSGLQYQISSNYGEIVSIRCLTIDSIQLTNSFLTYKDGKAVSFGQFKLFLEQFIVLPNYNRLNLKVGTRGAVIAEISIFPLKVHRQS